MNNNIFYVYEFCYPENMGNHKNLEPFYIGKGQGKRCRKHLYSGQKDNNRYKKNVIHKIRLSGKEPIIKKVAINLNEQVAFEFEKFLIAYYGRRDNKTGILCNMTDGGEGVSGLKRSYETRMKMSKPKTDKTRSRMSDSAKGKKLSEETRRKISETQKGRIVSKETKLKMSNPVSQYTLDNILITTFSSSNDAQKEIKIHRSCICKVCNGKRKSAGGYIWKYA